MAVFLSWFFDDDPSYTHIFSLRKPFRCFDLQNKDVGAQADPADCQLSRFLFYSDSDTCSFDVFSLYYF